MSHHLLVVDDEEEIRELLREAFKAAGYRVTGVGTLAEAMQVVRHDPPHVVLTDLQLEEADGFTVVEQVSAAAPALPIIMLTGVIMDPAQIPPEVRDKIACYIPKTTSLATILGEVKRLVR